MRRCTPSFCTLLDSAPFPIAIVASTPFAAAVLLVPAFAAVKVAFFAKLVVINPVLATIAIDVNTTECSHQGIALRFKPLDVGERFHAHFVKVFTPYIREFCHFAFCIRALMAMPLFIIAEATFKPLLDLVRRFHACTSLLPILPDSQ
jgi:hypothetical protein